MGNEEPVLEIDHLHVEFQNPTEDVPALRDINLQIGKGEILGLVGESGCGKSLTSLATMNLLPKNAKVTAGDIRLTGDSIARLSERKMRKYRGNKISMIFQEPMTALNPLVTIGEQISEALKLHKKMSATDREKRVIELLDAVGIPEPKARVKNYPFELSGGMRQRVMIASALACDPEVIIADEPTTALDVTIQAQILELLKDIRDKFGTSILLITHDMGVIADSADRVAVMYAGQVVEVSEVRELFANPNHPYTFGLLDSIPKLEDEPGKELSYIPGTVPELSKLPVGCPFQDRCPNVSEKCRHENPPLLAMDDNQDHVAACWNPVRREHHD